MDLVTRAKNILLAPKAEWPVIAGETTSTANLFTGYIIPLAAVGPVVSLIVLVLHGAVGTGILALIFDLIRAVVSVYILAFVCAKLAPNFGGRDDIGQALKLAAYAATAVWLAGAAAILLLVPSLLIIAVLVALVALVYTIYLFFLGASPVMGVPQERAVGYTVVSIIIAIVIYFVLGFVIVMIVGGDMMMRI